MYAAHLDNTITRQPPVIPVRNHEHDMMMRNNPSPGDVIDHYWRWDVLNNGTGVSSDA